MIVTIILSAFGFMATLFVVIGALLTHRDAQRGHVRYQAAYDRLMAVLGRKRKTYRQAVLDEKPFVFYILDKDNDTRKDGGR